MHSGCGATWLTRRRRLLCSPKATQPRSAPTYTFRSGVDEGWTGIVTGNADVMLLAAHDWRKLRSSFFYDRLIVLYQGRDTERANLTCTHIRPALSTNENELTPRLYFLLSLCITWLTSPTSSPPCPTPPLALVIKIYEVINVGDSAFSQLDEAMRAAGRWRGADTSLDDGNADAIAIPIRQVPSLYVTMQDPQH